MTDTERRLLRPVAKHLA